MKITSENFIKYFKKGKEDALEFVIDKYIGIVKAIIYNALISYKDSQLIEECISDTFLGAFENAKQFKGDQEDFSKWICTIAKFKAIDIQRKSVNSPKVVELNVNGSEVKSAEDEFFSKYMMDELLLLMEKLEQIDHDIFIMKYFFNMKNEEIAHQLGLTKAAVDNRLYRGKKRLQQLRLGGVFS